MARPFNLTFLVLLIPLSSVGTAQADSFLINRDQNIRGCSSHRHLDTLLQKITTEPYFKAVGTALGYTNTTCPFIGPFPGELHADIQEELPIKRDIYDRFVYVTWKLRDSDQVYHSVLARGTMTGVWNDGTAAIFELRSIGGVLEFLKN